MKGFFIDITNNLLDPKHVKGIGNSVWLFMWCLDRMTSISEEGIGLVLGGKPITYEEVEPDLGIEERTYRRWVSKLRDGGYINTKQAPYGLIFSVNKAKKRYARNVQGSAIKGKRYARNSTSNIRHNNDKIQGHKLKDLTGVALAKESRGF